jgi:hypothetical protein
MGSNLIAGLLELKVNGEIQNAKGNFTYNLGKMKKEAIVGADRVHGYKGTPQVPFIEGEITDRSDLNVEALVSIDNATITLSLANGKVIVLKDAWYAADGDVGTEEANIQLRFEGMSAEEVR